MTLVQQDKIQKDIPIEDILSGKVSVENKKWISFGTKVLTFLGFLFVLFEFDLNSYHIQVKIYSINASDLSYTCIHTVKHILQNI